MPFQLSPGVNVTEIDLTGIVPAVATSTGAIAGIFPWGPIGERVLVDKETTLVNIFGTPTSNNAETFFTAANFLNYGSSLYVVRAANTTSSNTLQAAYNSFVNAAAAPASNNLSIPNAIVYANNVTLNSAGGLTSTYDSNIQWAAKYAGQYGNSLRISVCDTPNAYSSNVSLLGASATGALTIAFGENQANVVFTGSNSASVAGAFTSSFANGDLVLIGNNATGLQLLQVANVTTSGSNSYIAFTSNCRLASGYTLSNTVNGNTSVVNLNRKWQYSSVIGSAPTVSSWQSQYGNNQIVDQVHVVVVDQGGLFTGTPGTVLETYQGLSRGIDNTTTGGASNYYPVVINQSSKYVWWIADRPTANSGLTSALLPSTNSTPFSANFTFGSDGYTESNAPLATLATGYDQFGSAENVDVSLILQGKPAGGPAVGSGLAPYNNIPVGNYNLANYIIDNICETRKDCIVLITPDDNAVKSNPGLESSALVSWRGAVHDSSYAVLDSGYKYQYDRYNDVYRWVPTNGDVGGLCVRTDNTRDPWWSPAGFNRGQIKNLVKLRYNPTHADRDLLYPNGINPLVTFPGQGTVLFGDKTCQSKPSAFDHINVRRLFIVLEKAIATAAKFFLFEFNDAFTQAQFKALVNPYLRDIQGRRGITDFLVVCDGTNNTPEVVDSNRFIGDIYIKPARSINYIQLNFVAVRTGVQFSEIVGKF